MREPKPWHRAGREGNPLTCDLQGRDWFRACGRLGAMALNAQRTPEQRSAAARHAVSVRWARYRAAQRIGE